MISQNGFAIAIAWPNFMGKQAGSWYDPLMRFLRINNDFHYKVGHASLILVNSLGDCFYFDCGRYDAPYQKGRIRDCSTDNDLNIQTKATLKNGKISNIGELLKEIQLKKACKGEGSLKAAYCTINFESAYSNVKCVQKKGIISFGPFIRSGTNCCRFVQRGIIEGKPILKNKWKLKMLFPFLPKPITIVKLLPNNIVIQEREKLVDYKLVAHKFESMLNTRQYYNKSNVKSIIEAPTKPNNIPSNCQWLGGEVSGSWFHLSQSQNNFVISRYSENGIDKFTGIFVLKTTNHFDINKPFQFTYLSHCNKVTVSQASKIFEFYKV